MLTDKNYHMWARQATFGLIARDKLELVNGERPVPIPKKNRRANRRGEESSERMTKR
jgi:hypothetical protein